MRDAVRLEVFLTYDDNRHLRALARSGQEFLERFGMHNRRAWFAVFDVMNVVGSSRKRIDGHSHRANFHGAKKRGHELRGVRQNN